MTWSEPRPPPALPGPGWYPDPGGAPDTVRWWNGSTWTAYVYVLPPGALRQLTSGAPPPTLTAAVPLTAARALQSAGAAGPAPVIPLRALWWALAGFVIGELAGGVLAASAAVASGTPSSQLTSSAPLDLIGEFGLWAGLLGACVVVSRRFGTLSLGRDLLLKFRPADLGIGALAALGAFAVDLVVGSVFLHTRFQGTNTQLLTGQRHDEAGFVVVTLIAAVGAPFFEELFFRGLVRRVLESRVGSVAAVLLQAGLFGFAHFEPSNGLGNVSVVVAIAGVGLVLGFTVRQTRRLGSSMVGHGLFNLVVAVIVVTH